MAVCAGGVAVGADGELAGVDGNAGGAAGLVVDEFGAGVVACPGGAACVAVCGGLAARTGSRKSVLAARLTGKRWSFDFIRVRISRDRCRDAQVTQQLLQSKSYCKLKIVGPDLTVSSCSFSVAHITKW